MTKVMYVHTVITVFIFLFIIFGYFFYARRGAYLMVAIFLKTLNSNFRGQIVHFRGHIVHFGAVTDPLHRSYGIKRWKGNGNNYFIHAYYIPLRSHDSHDSSKLPYAWIVYVQVIVEKSFLYPLKKGQKPEKWSWPAPLVHVHRGYLYDT